MDGKEKRFLERILISLLLHSKQTGCIQGNGTLSHSSYPKIPDISKDIAD